MSSICRKKFQSASRHCTKMCTHRPSGNLVGLFFYCNLKGVENEYHFSTPFYDFPLLLDSSHLQTVNSSDDGQDVFSSRQL